jgi:hypothetical protein
MTNYVQEGPAMKATTHSETRAPLSLWPRQPFPAMTTRRCSRVDTHH